MIELKNINKKYKNKIIFDNLSIKFDIGLNMIYGSTGTGKTTLLNMIYMIDNDYAGDILIDSEDIKKINNKKMSLLRNKKISYIFQDFKLFNNLNVIDNLMIPTYINKEPNSLDILISKFQISDLLYKKVNKLSGGEKQKITIVRSLVNNPNIILADEPTSSLDAKSEKVVMNMMKQLSKEKIIIFVTHNESLKKYADNIYILKNDKIYKEYE